MNVLLNPSCPFKYDKNELAYVGAPSPHPKNLYLLLVVLQPPGF